MEDDLDRCMTHPFERCHRLCGQCGNPYCENCLVSPFGPKKAPLCLQCAVSAAGLRKAAALPPTRTKREIDRLNALMAKEQAASEIAGASTFAPYEHGVSAPAPPPLPAPMTGTSDDGNHRVKRKGFTLRSRKAASS
jgi:hypothetical protein